MSTLVTIVVLLLILSLVNWLIHALTLPAAVKQAATIATVVVAILYLAALLTGQAPLVHLR